MKNVLIALALAGLAVGIAVYVAKKKKPAEQKGNSAPDPVNNSPWGMGPNDFKGVL